MNKTIAFGVEIGIINAQLAARTIGSVKVILMFASIAKEAKIGKNKKVVAVLLVNSVMIDVNNVKQNIIFKTFQIKKKLNNSDKSFAKPVFTISPAIESPPPNKIKTFPWEFL